MTKRDAEEMRTYWDERARVNPAWYVDTSLAFDAPDMERFFEAGRTIVATGLDPMPTTPPSRELAVEIGSGIGRVCLALSERFDRVIGVDISPEMVERARDLVHDDRISFVVGDGVSLTGVADASADLVFSFTVFQHIPAIQVIEEYIAEAGRVLKPDGVFVFQWNNTPGALRWILRRWALAKLQRFGRFRERYDRHNPAFLGSRVPLERIRRAVDRAGMDIRKTDGLDTLYAWAWAVRR